MIRLASLMHLTLQDSRVEYFVGPTRAVFAFVTPNAIRTQSQTGPGN